MEGVGLPRVVSQGRRHLLEGLYAGQRTKGKSSSGWKRSRYIKSRVFVMQDVRCGARDAGVSSVTFEDDSGAGSLFWKFEL